MSLQKVYESDAALALLDEDLIRRARELYALGFDPNVRRAQMSALGDLIRTARNHGEAVLSVRAWMENQLDKLRERERRDRKRSWLVDAEGSEPDESLGEALVRWISGEVYLPAPVPEGLDRLAALRRFWARFDGLHRYECELEEAMPLTVPAAPREEGGRP